MNLLQSTARTVLLAGTTCPAKTTSQPILSALTRYSIYRNSSQNKSEHKSWIRLFSITPVLQKKDPKNPQDIKQSHDRDTSHIPVSMTEAFYGANEATADKLRAEEMKKLAATPTFGSLASSSILSEEVVPETPEEEEDSKLKGLSRKEILDRAGLYPDENKFMRSQRLRQIRRRGRLTKAQAIAQTEKVHRLQSYFIKTSIKKLAPLARQISGKPLIHAMTQMRFSLKKAAREVLKHLEHAKAEAIVTKGFNVEKTFISQAWVGRGRPALDILPRARGRADKIIKPYTCITVELKEEKTKERIRQDKAARDTAKRPWVAMPSKPIYGQQQYYTW